MSYTLHVFQILNVLINELYKISIVSIYTKVGSDQNVPVFFKKRKTWGIHTMLNSWCDLSWTILFLVLNV